MPGIVQDDPEPDRLRSQTDPLIVALIAAAGLHVETVGYRMGRLVRRVLKGILSANWLGLAFAFSSRYR